MITEPEEEETEPEETAYETTTEETTEADEDDEEEDEDDDIYSDSSDYDFSSPVPESAMKTGSYYDTCAFVGDSHTNGLGAYGFVDKTRVFAKDGLSIKNIRESISPASIASVTPENVYLMMGTNGVAWLKPEDMISSFEDFVYEIVSYLPAANIYILSIPPVSYERATSTDPKKLIDIDKINTYNEKLLEMAEENSWYFVDTNSAVCNAYGYLDSGKTSDGVHMSKDLYKSFTSYILSHTVD